MAGAHPFGGEDGDDREWHDLAELAASEWGISLDEFWDERDNTPALLLARGGGTADYGLTYPRLNALIDSYERRRKADYHRIAHVIAVAEHDPKHLTEEVDRMFADTGTSAGPSPAPIIERSAEGSDWDPGAQFEMPVLDESAE